MHPNQMENLAQAESGSAVVGPADNAQPAPSRIGPVGAAVLSGKAPPHRIPRGKRYPTPVCQHCDTEAIKNVGASISRVIAEGKRCCQAQTASFELG